MNKENKSCFCFPYAEPTVPTCVGECHRQHLGIVGDWLTGTSFVCITSTPLSSTDVSEQLRSNMAEVSEEALANDIKPKTKRGGVMGGDGGQCDYVHEDLSLRVIQLRSH